VIVLSVLLILVLLAGGFAAYLYKLQRDQTTKANNQVTAANAQVADLTKQLNDTKAQLQTAQQQAAEGQRASETLATCKAAVAAVFASHDVAGVQAALQDLATKCSA
jgi:outer membrane murein-binding lipoprotein Lpp